MNLLTGTYLIKYPKKRVYKYNKKLISDLFKKKVSKYEWLIYDKMYQNSNLQYITRCTLIKSITVCLFTGPIKHSSLFKDSADLNENENINLKIDNLINFDMNLEVHYIFHFKINTFNFHFGINLGPYFNRKNKTKVFFNIYLKN